MKNPWNALGAQGLPGLAGLSGDPGDPRALAQRVHMAPGPCAQSPGASSGPWGHSAPWDLSGPGPWSLVQPRPLPGRGTAPARPGPTQARPRLGPKPGRTDLHWWQFRMPVSPISAQPFSSRSHFWANHAESMPHPVVRLAGQLENIFLEFWIKFTKHVSCK